MTQSAIRTGAFLASGLMWITATAIGLELHWTLISIVAFYVVTATALMSRTQWARWAVAASWFLSISVSTILLSLVDTGFPLTLLIGPLLGSALFIAWALPALMFTLLLTEQRPA